MKKREKVLRRRVDKQKVNKDKIRNGLGGILIKLMATSLRVLVSNLYLKVEVKKVIKKYLF